MSSDSSTKHIVQSLGVNLVIATGKGLAAFFTGSSAMLAETIHSGADCANQVLLLIGVHRARQPPSAAHPLGYGRAMYFWSFIVSLLLFSGGGLFSLYEGWHKLHAPALPDRVWLAVAILVGSLVLEGVATYSNIQELHRRRGTTRFFDYLWRSKDSDLVVVFGENSAATLGLGLALSALVTTHFTRDPLWDAAGTMAIGAVLAAVAVFLAVKIKSLLVGEAADPAIAQSARELVSEQEHFRELLEVVAVQQGPGEVLLALKVRLSDDISADQVCDQINAFEVALRQRHPDVKWSFIEPDYDA